MMDEGKEQCVSNGNARDAYDYLERLHVNALPKVSYWGKRVSAYRTMYMPSVSMLKIADPYH